MVHKLIFKNRIEMRKLFFFYLLAGILFTSSCDKYLDIVPDDTAQLKDAFKNETTAENFIYSCYSFIPQYSDLHYNPTFWFASNETVGSYHWGSQYYLFIPLQQNMISAANPTLDYWQHLYRGIRQCYIFLENIDNVTPLTSSATEFTARKKQWIAEANFLIGYYHYMLLQIYGPIVLVEGVIPTSAVGDEMFKSRSTYDECVDFIADKLDKASGDLPATVTNAEYGRATKSIAQAIKSRIYMYAASPLFNGNHEFYSDFTNADGTHLIAQTFDKEKWKTAMDESKKAIDLARSNGHELYKYTKTTIADPFEQAVMNTRWQMVDPWNSELIWGYSNGRAPIQSLTIPRGWHVGEPFGGLAASLSAVETFYSNNGIPAETDPSYDWSGRFTIASGDSTIKLHRNREPRFYAYIGFDRGKYEISGEVRTLRLRAGETNGTSMTNGEPNLNVDHLYSGYAIKKGVHPGTVVNSSGYNASHYPWPIIRLAELYLNYAEAYANYHGTLDATALGYLNEVRRRAGVPNLEVAYGSLPTGNALIAAIQREKLIEFMFEGHSLNDIKRWKRAESYYAADRNGMRGLNSQATNATEFYKETKLARPFIFERKTYLYPIQVTYLQTNTKLVQNPGW